MEPKASDALLIRCPRCQSAFSCGPETLKRKAGWLRCGACSEVFDGYKAIEGALMSQDDLEAIAAPSQEDGEALVRAGRFPAPKRAPEPLGAEVQSREAGVDLSQKRPHEDEGPSDGESQRALDKARSERSRRLRAPERSGQSSGSEGQERSLPPVALFDQGPGASESGASWEAQSQAILEQLAESMERELELGARVSSNQGASVSEPESGESAVLTPREEGAQSSASEASQPSSGALASVALTSPSAAPERESARSARAPLAKLTIPGSGTALAQQGIAAEPEAPAPRSAPAEAEKPAIAHPERARKLMVPQKGKPLPAPAGPRSTPGRILRAAMAEPDFMKNAPRAAKVWTMACAGMLALAAFQGAYWGRAELASAAPFSRPLFEWACAKAGCSVGYAQNEEAVEMQSADLKELAEGEKLQFRALVISQAGRQLKAPGIRLEIMDASGEVVARRDFSAQSWLGREYLDPRQEAEAKLVLEPLKSPAGNFKAELVWPKG